LAYLKRRLGAAKRGGLRQIDSQAYNTLRNEYTTEIKKAKMETWRQFAGDLIKNVWGKAFSWAKNGSKTQNVPASLTCHDGSSTTSLDETANLLLYNFFPEDTSPAYAPSNEPLKEYERTVDQHRVKKAIWRIKPAKAPSLDGITAGMLRIAWPVLGDVITGLFGDCITKAIYPSD